MLSRRRIERGERGVALVEFALIFPIFMTLVLGMFSGGRAYDRKITLTNAAREGARYGATLDYEDRYTSPFPATTPSTGHALDQWLFEVMKVVEQNAEGELGANAPGLSICVGYFHPSGPDHTTDPDGATHILVRNSSGTNWGTAGTDCFTDGLDPDDRRVQVEVSRKSDIQLLFFKVPVTVTARSVMRFEAAP